MIATASYHPDMESLQPGELLGARDEWDASACSMARALEVLSTRSAMLVMREAFYGARRFEEFVRRAGTSEPVVAARLRELTAAGLLRREDYRAPGQRTRQQYRLTASGADLLPAIVALMQWGDRWLASEGGPVQLRHHGCGGVVHAELRCDNDHPVTTGEIDLVAHKPVNADD